MKSFVASLFILSFCIASMFADNVYASPDNGSPDIGLLESSTVAPQLFPSAHQCNFERCPYIGLSQYEGVIHIGQRLVDKESNFTDLYYIDLLHWEYPNEDYDQLEDRLFRINETSGDDAAIFEDEFDAAAPNTRKVLREGLPLCPVCPEVTNWASNGDGTVLCKTHSL